MHEQPTPERNPSNPAVNALREALGADVVSLPHEFAGRKNSDSSRMPCAEPLALIRPRNTEHVSTALRICHEHAQPVVTQGGLTGLAGGAIFLGGEVALSLELMTGIESIDAVSASMTVLSGTPLQIVQEAADAAGFMFPLDLGARGSCTIGGNLATNAGGNRVIKYGMMRDQVLDIEAVLADGSIVGGLRAVLRLRPKPRAVSTAWCGLPNYDAVTTLLRRAQESLPAGVSAFEVMWPGYYDFVLSRLPELRAPLEGKHAFYVLLESSGADPERQADAFEDFLSGMLEEGLLSDAALASSESDAAAFWAIRDAPGEYQRLIPGRVSFDVSFSIADVGVAAHRCEQQLRERWPNASILIYGHLGDGNLHIVVQEPDWPRDTAPKVQAVVYGVTGEMGGSVSAEHGIGTKKLKVLALSRTPAELAAMRAIKAALDPLNILNPGKLLPP